MNEFCGSCGRPFNTTDNKPACKVYQGCPTFDCRKEKECCLTYTLIPSAMGDDSEGSEYAPENGRFSSRIVEYEVNGHIYLYDADGIPVFVYAPLTIDKELSPTSHNAVENRAIYEEVFNYFTEDEWQAFWKD